MDGAAHRFETARELFDRIGDAIGVCVSDLSLGDVASARGDLVGAEQAYRMALATATRKGAEPLLGEALIGMAEVMIGRGRVEEAARLLAPTLECEVLDREAVDRRERLRTSLALHVDSASYQAAPLRDVALTVLSQPPGA